MELDILVGQGKREVFVNVDSNDFTINALGELRINPVLLAMLRSYPNHIINGAMQIAQAGTSFAAAADGTKPLDMWTYGKTGAMVHTVSQSMEAPASQGFYYSQRLELTTPDDAIAAGDYTTLVNRMEGYNYQNIKGKTCTLSFWVRATTPGIYSVAFRNGANTRSYVSEYTINVANTWEYKTITVTFNEPTGVWEATAGIGLNVNFTLASGATYQAPANDSWQTGSYIASANQVNGTATGSTNFYITGVQLNEGSEALPFVHEDYATVLAKCRRYYETGFFFWGSAVGLAGCYGTIFYKAQKRVSPTPTITANTAMGGGAVGTVYANLGGLDYMVVINSTNTILGCSWIADARL